MKIVHINFADKAGGAAIAAYRHNEAMIAAGIDSKMLVVRKTSGSKAVLTPSGRPTFNSLRNAIYNSIDGKIASRHRPYATWSYAAHGFNLAKEPAIKEANAIMLHWVNGATLSNSGVERILQLGKPVIWFLHDMWPFTGGCHYTLGCDRYTTRCGNCPMLNGHAGSGRERDLAWRQFSSKLRHWNRYSNLSIMAPSRWLLDCAAKSMLFKDRPTTLYRNVIDTSKFKPCDKIAARQVLNLPLDKKLVLFGAESVSSPYKGWPLLREALSSLDPEQCECVVFGGADPDLISFDSHIRVNYVGRLADDYSLILLYNACDLFVTPSIADNFPNVILEAMACGLPCVGFDIGGIPEMIHHLSTGYVAPHVSPQALATGIDWVLHEADVNLLAQNATAWVETNASYHALPRNFPLLNPGSTL